ncbi:MAG: hypothetical protein WBB23_10045 [Desulforhopalus sp.]
MIGESSGATALINNERIQRDNQVRSESRALDQGKEIPQGQSSDVTSFSSEALALARNVVPVGGSAEQGQTEPPDRGQEKSRNDTARFLDIRV